MMDTADLELFEQSLRHANQSATGPELDAALLDLGWHEALAVDPHAAVSTQLELQGRALSTSSALAYIVASVLGQEEPLPVVLPGISLWNAPGRVLDDRVAVEGLGTAVMAEAPRVLVPVATAEGHGVVVVSGSDLTTELRSGLDPDLGLAVVTADLPVGSTVSGSVDWPGAVDAARLALSHELTGASRTMLELARQHALEREQFGRPIAQFQAVRHRLAEALIAIETGEAVLGAAWLDGTSETAAMAKASTGRAARTVAKHCQQVLAGIGFTTEHPFHGYLRRVLVLDELFGSARALTKALGEDVLATGQLPPLLPL